MGLKIISGKTALFRRKKKRKLRPSSLTTSRRKITSLRSDYINCFYRFKLKSIMIAKVVFWDI
jgi:hypothetical protein